MKTIDSINTASTITKIKEICTNAFANYGMGEKSKRRITVAAESRANTLRLKKGRTTKRPILSAA